MKHFKTFESFMSEKVDFVNETEDITLTEKELNEGTAWFPGETIDDRINDGSPEWTKFTKSCKKGDTFTSNPDGVELNYCKPADVKKPKISPEVDYVGHNYGKGGSEDGALCTVIDKRKCIWLDSDYDEDDQIETIFYTVNGVNNKVYMLGEM